MQFCLDIDVFLFLDELDPVFLRKFPILIPRVGEFFNPLISLIDDALQFLDLPFDNGIGLLGIKIFPFDDGILYLFETFRFAKINVIDIIFQSLSLSLTLI